jgi:catechol 2,3-dioxygenase-like lactoylglutathione lyase family enzyme
MEMKTTLNHVHLFASKLEESLRFYQEMFGAKIISKKLSETTAPGNISWLRPLTASCLSFFRSWVIMCR